MDKVVRTSMSSREYGILIYVQEKMGLRKPQDAIRYLITREYDEWQKKELTYGMARTGRAVARESKNETLAKIRAMDIYQLRTFLGPAPEGIGYLRDEEQNEFTGLSSRETITADERTGEPMLTDESYEMDTGKVTYTATKMTVEEIIKDILKKKLI